MTKLLKLQISGVRSFSPKEESTVSFCSPVTLILGQNGSGKTTLIEAIRFSLTGELPSGSKQGQGFINDPQFSNKSTTKASLKLEFVDRKGDTLTICRIIQVSATADSKLVFKSVNNALRVEKQDTGRVVDVSGRCVDVNSYISQCLNVSPSILNNVIFCHQENSTWPLDESNKLKNKFDEIFDAVKYNKFSDIMRKAIKARNSDLKIKGMKLSQAEDDKKRMDSLKDKIEEREAKLRKLREEIEGKQRNMTPIEERIEEILSIEDKISSLQTKLTKLKGEKQSLLVQQQTLKNNITEILDCSDDELESKIGNFTRNQEVVMNEIGSLEIELKNIDCDIQNDKQTVSIIQEKLAALKENQKQYELKLNDFKKVRKEARSLLNVSSSKTEICKEDIGQLKLALNGDQGKFDRIIAESEAKNRQIQENLDKIRELVAKNKANLESKQAELTETKRKLQLVTEDLNNMSFNAERIESLNRKLEEVNDNLKGLMDKEKIKKLNINVQESNLDILKLDRALEELEREYSILQNNYLSEQRIEEKKEMISEKQQQLNEKKNKHSGNFMKIFGQIIKQNFHENVKSSETEQKIKLESTVKEINKLQKQVTTLEANIKHQQDMLKQHKQTLKVNKEKIAELCGNEPFNDTLNTSQKLREKYQKDRGEFSSGKILYEAFIEEFEKENPCCPVCSTNFTSKQKIVQEVVVNLKRKVANLPEKLTSVELKLEKESERFNKLQQLKPSYDEIELLENGKIPLMEDELEDQKKQFQNSIQELNQLTEKKKELDSILSICREVAMDSCFMDQCLEDIETYKKQIESLKEKLVFVSSNKSRLQVQQEIDMRKSELAIAKKKNEADKNALDKNREQCEIYMLEKDKITTQLNELKGKVQDTPMLSKQKSELTKLISKIDQEVGNLQKELQTNHKKLTEAQNNKEETFKKYKNSIEAERKSLEVKKSTINKLDQIYQSIEEFRNSDNDINLKMTEKNLEEVKEKEETALMVKSSIIESLSDKKQSIAKSKLEFLSLENNKLLRIKLKESEVIEEEIKAMDKKIGDNNYSSIYKEKQKLLAEKEKIKKELSIIEGTVSEIEKTISEFRKELDKPENKQAYNNYKKHQYDVALSKHILSDMELFLKAIEKSVLQFHKERMVQINKIIRSLWRDIYKGNDIDFIEIQAEETNTTGNSSRKSYDYKVVQVKKDVELDMRGRCSAGQKILASLIIRIALAETFSSHCGILALDEPTTNLDRENIRSLAETLSRLITIRERDNNFQLLIITHDEEFLNMLNTTHGFSSCLKVKRNREGFSTIEKVNL